MASDSPKASSHGGSTPPIRPATPSTSKEVRQKLGSWFRRPFSRGKKGEVVEPQPVGAGMAQEPNPQGTSTTAQEKLLVTTERIDIKQDALDPTRKAAGYELAIKLIEIFQSGVEYTDFILPTPVGKALEQLTKVLGVLKKMVENKEAWKGLHETLVQHGDQFNKQLVRLKQNNTKPNEDSALLGPLKDYSTALEKLSAKIILESGLVQQDTKGNAGWEKIKRFAAAYLSADSAKSQVETYRQTLRDAMQALSQDLLIYVAFSISEQPSQSAAPKKKIIAKRPPKVSQYYVSREREWKFMVDSIADSTKPGQKILAITGMGGCGKTQLVSYFLKEKGGLFTHVVYVDASSTANIETDLQTWAQSLGDGHEQDDWKNALYLLADGRWVYILDNADDPELDLPPFIPDSTDGTIIITSRNQAVGNLAQYRLAMGEMTEEEALSVLIKAARRESPLPAEELKSAVTLIKELGRLALAVVHVGAYCDKFSSVDGDKRHVFTFTRYLTGFNSNRAALMKKTGPLTIDGYRRLGVYTTLDLSYEKLPQSAKEFFRVISNCHYADIPMEMLVFAAERRFCDPKTLVPRDEKSISRLTALLGADRSASENHTEAAIQSLLSFSLVSTTFVEDLLFLRIHPLVQAWVRDKSSEGEDYGAMATQVLTACSIDSNINLYRHLVPHILERLKVNQSSSLHVNDQAALGQLLMRMGQFSVAETLFQEILKTLRRISMEETESTLWTVGKLAAIYRAQGRYSEAEKHELEVVEGRGRILGIDHLSTIAAAAHLASTYGAQARYGEAERLQLEVMEKRTRVLGVNHPDTITAASNLAVTYGALGWYTEAEKLEVEVMEKRRRGLGVDHPDTITAASNLAVTYRRQGRHSEAEKLQLDVMEKLRRVLGVDHPDTITAAFNLTATYSGQGRHSEAEKLQLDVMEKRTRVLGVNHPDTITAASSLAMTYSSQGRHSEAEKLQLDVMEKSRRVLGVDHPDTIMAASILAVTYSGQGRHSEAEKLQLDVMEKSRRVLGVDHPDTITAAAHLAASYYHQKRYGEAEKLDVDIMERRRRILGANHPHTIAAVAWLAAIYRAQGRIDEAEKLEGSSA